MARGSTVAVVVSVGVHAVVGVAMAAFEGRPPPKPPVRITIVSVPSKAPAKAPEPEAPKPAPQPDAPKAAPKKAPAPKAAPAPAPAPAAPPPPRAAAAPPVDLAASFGVQLTGGTSANGLATPVGSPSGDRAQKVVREKVLEAVAPAQDTAACTETASRPKPLKTPQPAYPEAARAAEIEGKVRVELRLDEEGRVADARVLEGPGHGLDEAALEAVKGWLFEPARACGRAVGTTFVLSVRFTL